MLLNLNINISGNFSVKYNCDISKSKLVFPLPNESYSSLIASIVKKLFWIKPEYIFLGHPVFQNCPCCNQTIEIVVCSYQIAKLIQSLKEFFFLAEIFTTI